MFHHSIESLDQEESDRTCSGRLRTLIGPQKLRKRRRSCSLHDSVVPISINRVRNWVSFRRPKSPQETFWTKLVSIRSPKSLKVTLPPRKYPKIDIFALILHQMFSEDVLFTILLAFNIQVQHLLNTDLFGFPW